MSNRVVIIGRPNVGKSTLFNRIIGKRYAIVEDYPGVTRDKIEAKAEWAGKEFIIVDTGGLVPETKDELIREVKKVVEQEIPKADVILFVVDGKEGLNPLDQEIAKYLYPYADKVLLVVNKIDNLRQEKNVAEFYTLGFEKIFPISAQHGKGVGELLDEVVKYLKEEKVETVEEGIKVAFIGRPNVGKSSLVNAILKDERVIVSPIAGTTRDAIEIPFRWKDKNFILIDTAGVRRPSNVEYGIEFYSVGRSLKAIDLADVCCLVIDASEGPTRQDKRLGGLIERRYKGCVIVANKMDISPWSEEELEGIIRKELFFLDFAPIVFTVATKGKGVEELLNWIDVVYKDYTKQHKTSFVNRAVHKILSEKPPPRYRGKEVKVYYAFQESTKPPTIVLITNYPDAWKENYKRFFIKKLREYLNIKYAPIKLVIKGRED
ncbi:ribosome biogenesis GTPase Der [Aquifex aeolicus]|uniref:GTPase Der n=1 Tax=Aquifex aeolicus (strain VF5) TaxID=224324 RepID=DER_AQUAE|nr:ribosome biogenesis GTPase Der [Aquifex aeolicus]O67749.1 RecName: Full=GTPase Der; AltName: Full=GTP-binding protein EngA [Aquifex aeolicus VF5]AAC07715.1 GTP binding protein Era [Aquifex aeolicus VF5]